MNQSLLTGIECQKWITSQLWINGTLGCAERAIFSHDNSAQNSPCQSLCKQFMLAVGASSLCKQSMQTVCTNTPCEQSAQTVRVGSLCQLLVQTAHVGSPCENCPCVSGSPFELLTQTVGANCPMQSAAHACLCGQSMQIVCTNCPHKLSV